MRVLRKYGCSRIPSSIMLFCPTTTAGKRQQPGGIHKKARGCCCDPGKATESIERDHCHSAERAGNALRRTMQSRCHGPFLRVDLLVSLSVPFRFIFASHAWSWQLQTIKLVAIGGRKLEGEHAIGEGRRVRQRRPDHGRREIGRRVKLHRRRPLRPSKDRKSTRLNSSHT